MDSLGGILIKGLLGNLILGKFSLGLLSVEVVDPGRVWEAGGAGAAVPNRGLEEKRKKQVIISIRHNGEVTRKVFEVNDRTARISINILKMLNSVKTFAMKVFIKENAKPITPVVRIRNDRD